MSTDVVYDVALDQNTIRQVTQSQFSEQIEVLAGRMSGSPTIADQFIGSGNPVGEFTTTDLQTFLTAMGVGGSLINDGSTVKIPYHKRVSGASFQGGNSNLLVRGVIGHKAFACPQSVTAPRMGVCTAQGQVHFLSATGMVIPYAVQINQNLASQDFVGMYGLGPVIVNGVQVPRQIGFSVNFGIGLSEKSHYDGAPYPSDIFVEEFNPSFEFSQEDFDYLQGIAGGVAITSLTGILRRRASGSTYAPENSNVHITFSFADAFLRSQQVGAGDTKHGQQGVQVLGRTLVIGNQVAID
jgi:hypothetical protein